MRRVLRVVVGLGAVAVAGFALMQSSGAQIPAVPTTPQFTTPQFTTPQFTTPTFPPPPTLPPFTTTPPPTMPPFTTVPPPTMPPPTTTPPPTMPPPTLPPNVNSEIENIIDQLQGFGDQFSDVIDELRALAGRF